jgi:hypothetical protein
MKYRIFFRFWPAVMAVVYMVGMYIQPTNEKMSLIFTIWFAAMCVIYSRKDDAL